MQIQILKLQKPTDLDLHCLQRQDMSGFSRTRVNMNVGRVQYSSTLMVQTFWDHKKVFKTCIARATEV